MSNDKVTLDQISSFGDLVPAGHEFIVRAKSVLPKTTNVPENGVGGGTPYLSITFKILAGEFEGLEVTKTYFLKITKSPKNGKNYARGVLELCDDLKNVGKPLPQDYAWSPSPTLEDIHAVAKLVAERLKPAVTPRIKMRSVAEPQQEKNEATGKWGDALNADGSKKMRTRFLVMSAGEASAPARDASLEERMGVTVGASADPLSFL